MRLPVLRDVTDVAAYQLCCGCGACAYMSPGEFEIVDVVDQGRRPVRKRPSEPGRGSLDVCPGIGLAHEFDRADRGLIGPLMDGWGPVRRVWEGHAGDAVARYAGSSGGAATAIAMFALERGGHHGVLHTGPRPDAPYLNRTVLSRSREELLSNAGSRYAPASPCEGLELIERAAGPCVFIGKPCDIAGVQKARRLRPELDAKVGLTIGFFCAGTPSTKGTLELLRTVGVDDPSTVKSLRYRGNGWPGRWTVSFRASDGIPQERSLSYEQSWGFLQKHRQWRCYICPDHTGEFADIAVGDPWHKPPQGGEAGRSLIIARTIRGLEIVRAAAAAGYLVLEHEDPDLLPRSQPNLLSARGRLWGQMLALAVTRTPRPCYQGFATGRFWLSALTIRQKVRSVLGTARRVYAEKLGLPLAPTRTDRP